MTIGERIRNRRKELNKTIKTINQETGLSVGNISELENDKYLPSTTALIPLSEALNCSIDWIVTGKENEVQYSENLSIEEKELIVQYRLGNKPIFDKDIKQLTGDAGRLDDIEHDMILRFRQLSKEDKQDAYEIINLKYERGLRKGIGDTVKSYPSTNGNGNMVG